MSFFFNVRILFCFLIVFVSTSSRCLVLGGGDNVAPTTCNNNNGIDAENIISKFLSKRHTSLKDFHIHGWRWHTMSLVREAERLRELAEQFQNHRQQEQEQEQHLIDEKDIHPLKQATDYVIGFNLRGLHKIEAKLFFPWMREKLTTLNSDSSSSSLSSSNSNDIETTELVKAFESVMDQLESDRQTISKLGETITQNTNIICDESTSEKHRLNAVNIIVEESTKLVNYAKSMMDKENSLLVPAIADIVSESEQKSFNNKVLMNLGLLDSRLHLVGMYEAVSEAENPLEYELFQKVIPSIPQMMIPRWKRSLYEPQANVLNMKL